MLAANLDVFPGNTSTQIRYVTLGDHKVSGNIYLPFAGSVASADLENLLRGQHHGRAIFSFLVRLIWTLGLTPLGYHVLDIVQVRTKKQVTRIATELIVAAVQYMQIVWYWAIGNLPCSTVGRVRVSINRKYAVAVAADAGSPIPAIIRAKLGDAFPKSTFDRLPVVMPINVTSAQARSSIESHRLPATTSAKRWLRWCRLLAALVSIDILNGLAPNPAARPVSNASNTRLLATTAHAQSAWVRFLQGFRNVPSVTAKVKQRFTCFPPASRICTRCKVSLLAAATMAVAVRDFVRGSVCGMLSHAKFSFLELGLAVGRSHRHHGFCIGSHTCNYTTYIPYLKEYVSGGLHE